jgi:hypothetical protein
MFIYVCLYIYTVVGVSLPTHGPGHGDHAWVGPMGGHDDNRGVASYAHTSKNKIGLGYFVKHFRCCCPYTRPHRAPPL